MIFFEFEGSSLPTHVDPSCTVLHSCAFKSSKTTFMRAKAVTYCHTPVGYYGKINLLEKHPESSFWCYTIWKSVVSQVTCRSLLQAFEADLWMFLMLARPTLLTVLTFRLLVAVSVSSAWLASYLDCSGLGRFACQIECGIRDACSYSANRSFGVCSKGASSEAFQYCRPKIIAHLYMCVCM